MTRLPRRTLNACRMLIKMTGGVGNARYQIALDAALSSNVVAEAVRECVEEILGYSDEEWEAVRDSVRNGIDG